jgi:two-component system LytT family response regulator
MLARIEDRMPPSVSEPGFLQQLAVRGRSRIVLVAVGDIDWIAAAQNHVVLHVGERRFVMRGPLNALAARLDPRDFERIHRSTIVRLDRIAEIAIDRHGRYIVVLRSGLRLPTSRSYRRQLRQRLGWG